MLADIAMEEDDDGTHHLFVLILYTKNQQNERENLISFPFYAGVDDDEGEGMGLTFMQKRSAFKESSDRRVRAEQRKIKVMPAY